MGLDFGSKRIGVAISDELLITAQGVSTIQRKDLKSDLESIARIAKENDVAEIVIGLPVSMSGAYSRKTKEVLEFTEVLAKYVGVPVKTWDERLTTVQADRAMLEAGMNSFKRRRFADRVASSLILQGYLDSRKRRRSDA
jgi:putative Holliday junction resolvase